MTLAPQIEHVPAMAARPFDNVTGFGLSTWTVRLSRRQ